MALIKCPECDNKISDQADTCPKCGYELKTTTKNENTKLKGNNNNKYIILVLIIIAGAFFFFNQKNQTNQGNGGTGGGTGGTEPGQTTPSTNTGYSIYNSPYMGISFEFPSDYKVATGDDGLIYIGKNSTSNGIPIPYVMIGRYDNFSDQVQFLNTFTEYLKKEYSDVKIIIDMLSGNIGNRLVYGIAYSYTVDGHVVIDNRYAVVINNKIYMIGSKEENTNSTEINSVVEHVIASLNEGGA